MNKAESDRWAKHPYDPPPARGSGPEYHAEYQYWLDRHPEEKMKDHYGVGDRYLDHAGYVLPASEKNTRADDVTGTAAAESAEKAGPLKFRVTVLVTAAELTELEGRFPIEDCVLARPKMR